MKYVNKYNNFEVGDKVKFKNNENCRITKIAHCNKVREYTITGKKLKEPIKEDYAIFHVQFNDGYPSLACENEIKK